MRDENRYEIAIHWNDVHAPPVRLIGPRELVDELKTREGTDKSTTVKTLDGRTILVDFGKVHKVTAKL